MEKMIKVIRVETVEPVSKYLNHHCQSVTFGKNIRFDAKSKIFEDVSNTFEDFTWATVIYIMESLEDGHITLRDVTKDKNHEDNYGLACERLLLLSNLKQYNKSTSGNKKIVNSSCAWAVNYIAAYHIGSQTFTMRRWCFLMTKVINFINDSPRAFNCKSMYDIISKHLNDDIPENFNFYVN